MHSLFNVHQKQKHKLQQESQHQAYSFLRKYQQLINQPQSIKSKHKPNIFNSQRTLSLQNLRAISSSSKPNIYKSSRHKLFQHSTPRPSHSINSSQQSLEISAIHSHRSSNQNLSPNPEINFVSVVSKISHVEHQTYHNILINKKLSLNLTTKNQLQSHIEKLKQQILKQRHRKQKAMKNVQKMTKKLQKNQEILERIQKQRTNLISQINVCSEEIDHEDKKYKRLDLIHLKNTSRIKEEKKWIEFYEQKNEQTKSCVMLQRYQLNITKDNYLIERNRLAKNEGKFEQSSNERQKICRSVSKNVRRAIIEKELSV